MLRLWRLVGIPVLLGFVLLAGYLTFYLGAFKPVTLDLATGVNAKVVFTDYRGPYHTINSVLIAAENWAKKNQIPCPRTFGEFLDNPKTVAEDRLRSRVGCVLGPSSPLPTTEQLESDAPQKWQAEEISGRRFVRARFSGSPAIGPWKVYPKLWRYAAESNLVPLGTTIEIYTVTPNGGIETDYLLPVKD